MGKTYIGVCYNRMNRQDIDVAIEVLTQREREREEESVK